LYKSELPAARVYDGFLTLSFALCTHLFPDWSKRDNKQIGREGNSINIILLYIS